MSFHLVSKIVVGVGAMLATAVAAQALPLGTNPSTIVGYRTAQYYPQPYGYGPGYAPQRADPAHTCEQRGGDIYRIPSKHVRAIDVREVDRGIYQVTLSVRGQIAYCTADTRGNVLGFR